MQYKILGQAQDRKPKELASWFVLLLAAIWPWQDHGFSLLSYSAVGIVNIVYPIA